MFKSNFEKLLGTLTIYTVFKLRVIVFSRFGCKFLDRVTSNLLLEPDWPSTLEICDTIRQKDVQ